MDVTMEAYKSTPPSILVVPEIPSKVGMIHELENESQWVLGGGVHSDKWHNVLVLETTAHQSFFVEPLPVDRQ